MFAIVERIIVENFVGMCIEDQLDVRVMVEVMEWTVVDQDASRRMWRHC
jgi:hypothetical protein